MNSSRNSKKIINFIYKASLQSALTNKQKQEAREDNITEWTAKHKAAKSKLR